MGATCLNCDTKLQGSYCHSCGQKSSTHRITFAKFIEHDLIHGIFHLDKGILHTLKSLLFGPGYTAKNFIKGKRVMHYNIFALFIIIIALKTLIDLQSTPGGLFESDIATHKAADETLNHTISHYYKLFYLLCIPLISTFSYLLFRRLQYNFTEHVVLNCFLMAGGFFYSLLFSLLEWATGNHNLQAYGFIFMFFYLLIGYYQCTRGLYAFWGYLWRALSVNLLFLLCLILIIITIIFVFYGGSFEGSISF